MEAELIEFTDDDVIDLDEINATNAVNTRTRSPPSVAAATPAAASASQGQGERDMEMEELVEFTDDDVIDLDEMSNIVDKGQGNINNALLAVVTATATAAAAAASPDVQSTQQQSSSLLSVASRHLLEDGDIDR